MKPIDLGGAYKLAEMQSYNAQRAPNSTYQKIHVESRGGGVTSIVNNRVEDNLKFAVLNKAFAYAESKSTLYKASSKVTEALGPPGDGNFISKALINFLNDFRIMQGADISGSREQIISSSQNFTNIATSYVEQLKGIKTDIESQISMTVEDINSYIGELVNINKQLGKDAKDIDLLQQRDDLVLGLSKCVSINYSFSPSSGKVTIRTQGGNQLVNENGGCAKISYTQDSDLLSHNAESDVLKIMQYGSKNSATSVSYIQIQDVRKNFGGSLSGLFDVRDNLLPTALSNINDTISQIADKINNLHNNGSGFPPSTSFTSSTSMSLTDSAIFKGKINLAITDNQGKGVKDLHGNYVKPITIDFDKLSSRNSALSGQFTTQDIINEINQVAAGYGNASIGLGKIATPAGEAPQWLIDQVRLVPTSDVTADGSMSFQLELNNGSNSSTSFQVTDMIVLNQANVRVDQQPFISPSAINVAAGQNTKTGQNIGLRLNAADNQNTIRLKMCVIGANGLVEEAWADFKINNGANPLAGAQIMNQRSEAIPGDNTIDGGLRETISYAPGAVAAARITNAKFGGPTVMAHFVDSNDLSINDGSQQGYLKISASGGSGLIIDQATSAVLSTNSTSSDVPKNFGYNFGLNNFFTADPLNPASNIAVRQDILSSPSLIALGKPINSKVQKEVMVGQKLPSAVLEVANNPAPNDTLTIGATIFTFIAAPADDAPHVPNTIVIGATQAATTQNIYNALQNDHMRAVVTATNPNGTAHLMITGVKPGVDIAIASSNIGAYNWHISPNAQGILGNPITKLVSGRASAILDCGGGRDPVAGDIVKVNGVTFHFVVGAAAAPINTVPVQVGINAAASMTNLKTALTNSTDPRIAGLFDFDINPAHPDQLILMAKNAGFEGNNILVDSGIAALGGNAWKEPGDGAVINVMNLIGGFSKSETQTIDTYALEIGIDANTNMTNLSTDLFVFRRGEDTYTQTISTFVVGFLSDLSRTHSKNKTDSEVANVVSEKLHIEYDAITKLTKSNQNTIHAAFEEASHWYRIMWAIYQEQRKLRDIILGY